MAPDDAYNVIFLDSASEGSSFPCSMLQKWLQVTFQET